MPNWCYNQLYFTGNKVAVKEAKELFIQMMDECNKTNEGQKPIFIEDVEEGYFFDIQAYAKDNQISYETRWTPNIKDVVKIAEKWKGLDFTLNYQERGCLIFGKAIYKDGNLSIYDLSGSTQQSVDYDQDEDMYSFKDKCSASEGEILEDIFEEEFNITY